MSNMKKRIAWIILVAILSGCERAYIPLRVTVLDNGRPISSVEVKPFYPYVLDPFHPDDRPRKTNADGIAIVPLLVDVQTKSAGVWGYNYMGLDLQGPSSQLLPDQSNIGGLILLPTNSQVKDALERAGGNPRKVAPVTVIINVLTYDEYQKKYSK